MERIDYAKRYPKVFDIQDVVMEQNLDHLVEVTIHEGNGKTHIRNANGGQIVERPQKDVSRV